MAASVLIFSNSTPDSPETLSGSTGEAASLSQSDSGASVTSELFSGLICGLLAALAGATTFSGSGGGTLDFRSEGGALDIAGVWAVGSDPLRSACRSATNCASDSGADSEGQA